MYPSFYKEIVAIDQKRDTGLRVKPLESMSFAKDEAVLPALVDELPYLAKDFPVVFTSHEKPLLVAVMGHNKNSFVDKAGKWKADKYVPMVLRTYPFAGIEDKSGELVFCIDRKYSGLAKTVGEKIFAGKDGTLTEYGMKAANVAKLYVDSLKRTTAFTKKLKDLDLLMPSNVTVTRNEEKFHFSGLMQVNFKKLAEIPHEKLVEMINSNELYYLYLHQFSLTHFANVV